MGLTLLTPKVECHHCLPKTATLKSTIITMMFIRKYDDNKIIATALIKKIIVLGNVHYIVI